MSQSRRVVSLRETSGDFLLPQSCRRPERRLLNKALTDRGVGQDAPLDEPLTITLAARAKPSLVEPQHVGRRRQRGAFADVGQDIDETHELP